MRTDRLRRFARWFLTFSVGALVLSSAVRAQTEAGLGSSPTVLDLQESVEISRRPIYQRLLLYCDEAGECAGNYPTVPAKSQLEIYNISCNFNGNTADGLLFGQLHVQNNDSSVASAVTLVPMGLGEDLRFGSLNHAIFAVAKASQHFRVVFHKTAASGAFFLCHLTGHMVELGAAAASAAPSGPAGQPIPVLSGETSRLPYHQYVFKDCLDFECTFDFRRAPDDALLEIRNVSCHFTTTGTNAFFEVLLWAYPRNLTLNSISQAELVPVKIDESSGSTVWALNHAVYLFARPRDRIRGYARKIGHDITSLACHISGYKVTFD
jgi:hypothetical protein